VNQEASFMAGPTALALVCTLKKSPAESSSDLIARQVLDELAGHGVQGAALRVVDYDVLPGVTADEGPGDQWPSIRERVAAADMGTDYQDLDSVPKAVASATAALARNAAHLARLLGAQQYPPADLTLTRWRRRLL
jgi:type IV pilus biogenesis protein CpaD/CtpE